MEKELLFTPRTYKDLDGLPIETIDDLNPYELNIIKNASLARKNTDINNETFDDIDLPNFEDLPIISFVPNIKTTFDDSISIASNPFLMKYLS